MILFISQYPDSNLQKFAQDLQDNYSVNVIYKNVSDILSSSVEIFSIDNKFFSKIDGIDFSRVKICYINAGCSFSKDMFDFESKSDKEYAQQEWNATLTCLLNSSENTKFINKHIKEYSCDNQLENNLLFQKFNIDTHETFLTNNAERFLQLYSIFNQNLIIKNVVSKTGKSKLFQNEDLKNLKKLYLSPYIFQKVENGIPVTVLSIGERLYALQDVSKEEIIIPCGLKESLIKLKNELGINIATFRAMYNGCNFYFYDIDQNGFFSHSYSIFGDKFIELLRNYILEEYNR